MDETEKEAERVSVVAVPEPVFNRILATLSKRPYGEVAGLMNVLVKYKPQLAEVDRES